MVELAHLERYGNAPKIMGVCLSIVFLLTSSCQSDWGNQELLNQISELQTDQASSTAQKKPDGQAIPFSGSLLDEFLNRLSTLTTAKSIGDVSPWLDHCEIQIDAANHQRFLVQFSTRESLAGKTIVVILEKASDDTPMGFYEGDALYAWLKDRGLC